MDYEMKAETGGEQPVNSAGDAEIETAFAATAASDDMVQADIAALKDEVKGLGRQLIAARRPVLTTGGDADDTEARSALSALLASLRALGLVDV
ncbi:MAG: hypothetical protein AAF205_01800 [Pseudomonadota bacterium]